VAAAGGGNLTAAWLNRIGLGLGMAGVVILFIWGPPQPDLDPHIKRVTQGVIEATKQLKRRHEIMSSIGLGLIGLGFVLQFIATWLP
jgi:hypothetical protein